MRFPGQDGGRPGRDTSGDLPGGSVRGPAPNYTPARQRQVDLFRPDELIGDRLALASACGLTRAPSVAPGDVGYRCVGSRGFGGRGDIRVDASDALTERRELLELVQGGFVPALV